MEVEAAHAVHVVQALDLDDTIALKPNGLDVSKFFEILENLKA